MPNRKDLLKEFDRMEDERQQLLKKLSSYSQEILAKKPNPNAWSVAEVMHHLTVAEHGSLRYLNKKLEVGGHGKASLKAVFRLGLLNTAISLPVKYKAPKVVEIAEDSGITYPDALAEWNSVRENLRKAYEEIDEKYVAHDLFKHPFAGKLNLVQGVRFMRQHMNRHIGQIERTLKAVS